MEEKNTFNIDDLLFDDIELEEDDTETITSNEPTSTNIDDLLINPLEEEKEEQVNIIDATSSDVNTSETVQNDFSTVDDYLQDIQPSEPLNVQIPQPQSSTDSIMDAMLIDDSSQIVQESQPQSSSSGDSIYDLLDSFTPEDQRPKEVKIDENIDIIKSKEQQKKDIAQFSYSIMDSGRKQDKNPNKRAEGKNHKEKKVVDYYILEHDDTYITDEDAGYDLFYEDILPIDYEEIRAQNQNKGLFKKLLIAFVVFAIFVFIIFIIAKRYFTDESVFY